MEKHPSMEIRRCDLRVERYPTTVPDRNVRASRRVPAGSCGRETAGYRSTYSDLLVSTFATHRVPVPAVASHPLEV